MSKLQARGWGAVFLVAIGAAVAQAFGRFAYGVLLPAVRNDLGISNTIAGTLGTVNVGAYLIGSILVAILTSKHRLIDTLRLGFVFSGSGLALAAFSPNAWVLGIALFLTGLGGACIWIPAPAIAADAVAPEQRRLAIALMGAGIGVGIVFSGQISGYIRSDVGDEGWRTVYQVLAVIALVVVALTFLFLRHDQEQPTSQRAGIGGFAVLRRMRGWVPLTLTYTAYGFMYLLVIAFLTTRLEDDSGWSTRATGLLFTLLGVAIIPGGLIAIAAANRYSTRTALVGGFAAWSGLALLVLPGQLGSTVIATACLGALFAGLPAIITTYVIENTTVDDFGPSFAAATLAFGVAQMLAPQVGGAIADLTGSFTLVFIVSAGFAVLGAAAASRL